MALRTNRFKKGLLVALIIVVAVFLGASALRHKHSVTPTSTKATSQTRSAASTSDTIRLLAMGDMLPHDTVNQQAKTANGYDYTPMFSKVEPYMQAGDIRFCNQESPSAPSFAVSGYPTFNAPLAFPEDLTKVGCNLINLANNHADDRGQAGINETRKAWDSLPKLAVAGIARSPEEQNSIAYFTKGGIKFAFLSYAQCSNNTGVTSYGLNLLSKDLVSKQVAEAKQHADMIIVGTHWCRENVTTEDSDQDSWGDYLASQGVDIVIGTGPHVLQPVRRLPKAGGGETVDWYSLGNFLSSQEGINGLIGGIAEMDINVKTKTVTKLSFLPTYMHYDWTPAQQAADNLMARKNLKLYPLDQAAQPLADSRLGTTVAAQTDRVTKLLNTYTPITMLTSTTAPKH